MRVSMLVRLFKPRRISSTTVNSKNLRTWSGGNVNLLFLPNFGFTKFNQKSNFSSKQESYFSAIGGESDDPPPELTPEQVTNILTMNEVKFFSSGRIKTIECNQLAANNPTEDRLRVSKLNLKEFNSSSDNSSAQEATIFAVFDGHGGRLCADIITKRLFSYIALALCSDPVNVASDAQNLDKIVEDLQMIPNVTKSLNLSYGPLACERINGVTKERTKYYLEKYAQKLKETSFQSIEDKLVDAFLQCDQDLSDEIEHGLENPISNVLIHYYLSMAVSGCCVTLLMVHGDDCYIASTGDCKAVLGFREAGPANGQVTKSIDLTNEHNSDNAAETKRLLSSHPSNEKKTIIRNDRLLSHLMPFRAFGDFCYKWEIDKIKKAGLTKAFGLHIIPPNYLTPPYLTAKPEVSKISLSSKTDATTGDRFIVIATDGLWEQYGSSRCLIKQLFRHHFRLNSSFSSSIENLSVPKKVDSYQSYQHEEVSKKIVQHAQSKKASCDDEQPKEDEDFIDINSSTHLIRVALGTPPLPNMVQDDDLVPYQLQHKRLSTFLTLPPHLVRNFRDDITVIVLKLD